MRRTALIGAAALLLAGCGPGTTRQGAPGSDPARGHDLIVRYGCGGCHEIGGVAEANGRVGPSLKQLPGLQTIVGVLPNTPENLARFIRNAPRFVPQGTMPDLGVTPGEARDIAAYLEERQ